MNSIFQNSSMDLMIPRKKAALWLSTGPGAGGDFYGRHTAFHTSCYEVK